MLPVPFRQIKKGGEKPVSSEAWNMAEPSCELGAAAWWREKGDGHLQVALSDRPSNS